MIIMATITTIPKPMTPIKARVSNPIPGGGGVVPSVGVLVSSGVDVVVPSVGVDVVEVAAGSVTVKVSSRVPNPLHSAHTLNTSPSTEAKLKVSLALTVLP